MNKKTPNKILLTVVLLLSSALLLYAKNFNPDVEIKINGLVCSSCAIGIKNNLKKTKLIKEICDIYYRLNDLFKNITSALEDKKLTKTEINNIKADIKLLKSDFYELIRIFRK